MGRISKKFSNVYNGMIFDEGLCLDVLVEELITCELKAVVLRSPRSQNILRVLP